MGNDIFSQIHAAATAQAPPPSAGDIFSQIHEANQAPADNRSVWQKLHDEVRDAFNSPEAVVAGGVGGAGPAGQFGAVGARSLVALEKLTGDAEDWAKGKRDQAELANAANVAHGGQGMPIAAYTPAAGYDLLARTTGLANSFLQPKNLLITGGVLAANTNPFTGIPVDAALVAHGGYGVATNARRAFGGDPEAAERMLLSGSEMAGGAAGVGGQAVAGYERVAQALKGTAAGEAAVGGGAGPEAGPVAPGTPGVGRIARTLGITDPPPNQLLTKAIKPLASNNGWDAAIERAAPVMKAAEADLGHPITGVDDALEVAGIAKKGIWQQYAAKLKAAGAGEGGAGATIDGNEVADAMMNSIDKRTVLQNPDLVERIGKVADTYRRPMSVEEAEEFLQSANNDLHSYYAKNKVGQQVAAKDPEMGNVVAEANQLRQSLYSKLDELTGPGAAELKQQYGSLSNVENELLRRKNVAARQQPDSLAEQLSMARAYGKIAVGTLRMSPSSVIEGTQSLAAAKWLKARGTTDAMIQRAFQAIGNPPEPIAQAPAGSRPGANVGQAANAANATEQQQ
jgi:hypothetical protein